MRYQIIKAIIIVITLTVLGCATNKAKEPYSGVGPKNSTSEKAAVKKSSSGAGGTGLSSSQRNRERAEVSEEEEGKSAQDGQGLMDAALGYYEASQQLWGAGNLESAIEALDEAYDLIIKVDAGESAELIQQKDDLRFMISRRILEIYASRYTAVNGNHDAIPLIMNEHVKAEIARFTGPEKSFFLESYRRSGVYRDKIVDAFREAGLPEELSWLPLIESGFKVRALSSARALGLWQFIPSTGYKFGLSRDAWVDERLDPEKSTAAAIDYLEELHKIFGDWTTVLAAYNCGEGAVLKVIRNQKINYLDNFWDIYERLPRETARYVPRFLAVLHILKEPEKYGMEIKEPNRPVPADSIEVNKQMRLKDVAEKLGIKEDELKELNPSLRRQVTPDGPFVLRVPHGIGIELTARVDEIPKWTPPEKEYVYHRVRWGESVSTIAAKYGASVNSIVLANRLRSKNRIRAGQRLKIPLSGSGGRAHVDDLLPGGKYRVRKGDSLWLIAKRFGTNTGALLRENNLRSTILYVGQVLKVR